jgi:hypothetical protein
MAIESSNTSELGQDNYFQNKYLANIDPKMEKYFREAKTRIFSLSAGDRISKLVPFIMRVGVAKLLYAGNKLGVDPEGNKSYVVFSPDGTCTYNIERLKRGFAYGSIIKSDFNGMIAVSNSMPNGCGFSIFKLKEEKSDDAWVEHIKNKQKEIGEEHIYQLGKGNHFAGLYKVIDPVTGEDTNERHVVVHCSGHSGTQFLYNPEKWLTETKGFYEVKTPHGNIYFLEDDAKSQYLEKSKAGEEYNTNSRRQIMSEVFGQGNYEILEEITHQGTSEDGHVHKLGVQIHEGNQPIAFNPDEGIITVKAKPNLNGEVLDTDPSFFHVKVLGLKQEFRNLNFTPHGAGYEFRFAVQNFKITLNNSGISHLNVTLKTNNATNEKKTLTFNSFRDIRDYMTYRRKLTIMKKIFRADLIYHVNDLLPVKQIYPLVSIPGGTL